jgi:ATP-dependent helicase/nuclease subunit A
MKNHSGAIATSSSPPRSLVIRASAGTGKTFQLTNCLLRLLLSGASPRTILATTFTRKAAGEILNRVLERLAKASASDAETQKLAGELSVKIASREQVVTLLAQLLRQIDQLRISTLDSYFQQAAQSFAFELGLPFGWDVLEESDVWQAQNAAIRQVLRESSPAEIVNLMHLLDQGHRSWRVASQIRNSIEATHKTFLRSHPDAWNCIKPGEGLSEEAYSKALAELEALETSGRRFVTEKENALSAAKEGDFDYFLSNGVGGKLVLGETTYYSVEIPESWQAVYRQFIAHAQARALSWIAKRNEATGALASAFETQYQIIKRTRRQYEFDDVPRRLAEALQSPESHQRLAFRLDAGVDHLLLDEFQDTSAEQWRVLASTAKRVCEQENGDFFCVGDVKQAIYGWRGGSAQIFGAIEKQLKKVAVQHLAQSFRSATEIIGAVNQVMERLNEFARSSKDAAAILDWAKEFKAHSTAKGDLPGWVTLREAAPIDDAGGPSKAKLNGALLVAADLAEKVHAESPRHSIAILFRSNAPISRMVTLLRQRGIDASEEGGGSLLDSPAVETILSLIQLADHPGDSVARFHLETGPLHARLANLLATPPLFAAELRRSLLEIGYGAFVREWATRLAPSCSQRDATRLQQLIEIATEYDRKATLRPRDFAGFVARTKIKNIAASTVRVMTIHNAKGLEFDTVILPELEKLFASRPPRCVAGADHFLLPAARATRWINDTERPLLPAELQADHERDRYLRVQESLCTLYVAMTRAVHALHMIIPESRTKSTSNWSDLLRAALAKGEEGAQSGLLYSQGDPHWHRRSRKSASGKPNAVNEEVDWPTISFRIKAPSAPRNLPRLKPSMAAEENRFNANNAFRADSADSARFGTAIHFWFERVKWFDSSEVPINAEKLRSKGIALPGDDISVWRGKFDGYCKLPELRELLDEAAFRKRFGVRGDLQVQNEKLLAFLDEGALMSGQIDRLVFELEEGKPARAWIIDFKTDKIDVQSTVDVAEKIAHHSVQLEAYRRGVTATHHLPITSIEAYLVLLESGKVVSVSLGK